jgi:signal transduction histidine kinase/FixJ family two-component response regulator
MTEGVVLIIDDEPGIVRLCERLLARAGFDVLAYTQPAEALARLDDQSVDLLLVDIRMPGTDGFRVIDQARQTLPDLAVVIMTGFGTVEMAIQALRRGADGLILKPFAGAELVQSVQRALQDNRNKRDVARLQTLRPLFNITEALFVETVPERLQELLLDAVSGQLHCSQVAIFYQASESAHPDPVACRGPRPPALLTDAERGLIPLAADLGFALWVNQQGPGDAQLQASLQEMGLNSVLCVPVRLKGGCHIFWAARLPEEPTFSASDYEMFVILARQAAVAMENARLHAELRAYLRQVEESQRALIQAEKMATVGRLTTSIAHEINNPLQAVQNCLHLAGRAELAPTDQQKYLALAQSELDRLMRTVQRMLAFYRPGAVDRKAVNIHEVLERLLGLIGAQLQENQIEVKTKFSARLPNVLIVVDQIQQVFLNLALNAIEAMPAGGTLHLTTLSTRKTVDILFEDTGPGVPEAARERIFEPFVSSKESGSGLGLAVSYGIVAAHGGTLELVAGRGGGACFRVSLPIGKS